jgi:phospholipid/cholesterol/gamma-HCH transport system substrate-binding protein
MTRSARRFGALVAGLVLLLSGCGFRGAYSLSLPGGADVGSHPYSVQIQFKDVLDLVPQSGVRVADVPVGRVTKIALGGKWTAVVTVLVNGDVHLPANATAAIQQSSLLGEKYVELAAPTDATPAGKLGDGSLIPLDRTSRSVEVEELLGALSLVLNGGGLAQLQTINHELGLAMQGRESDLRDTLTQLDTFISGLDSQKSEINRALDSVNALAATLAGRTGTINKALDTIGPGLGVLDQQHDLLVQMLESLARLGDVGTRIINQSGADTVTDLQLLQPILSQLAAAGPDLANSLDLLVTYPFPASSLTSLNYRQDSRTGGYGLFTNMTATLGLDLRNVLCQFVIDPATGALKISTTPVTSTTCTYATPSSPLTSSTTSTTGTTGGSPLSSLAIPGLGGLAGTVLGPVTSGATSGKVPVIGLPDLGTTGGGQ